MKLRPFELALVIVFGTLAIGALVLLSSFSPSGSTPEEEGYVGPVQIWGTIPAGPVNSVLLDIASSNEFYEQVSYRFIPANSFNDRLVEALADGAGPDMILISHEGLVDQRKRIRSVSYENWPVRDLQDTYIDGSLVFALSDGIYGTPILVDPLMMYWNRDTLTNNGFLSAPKTWEELVNVQLPEMIDRSFDRTINRGVVAFGVYDNTQNAFGALSTLLIQSGSDMVSDRIESDRVVYDVSLNKNTSAPGSAPLTNSLSFYLRFGQPSNTLYSWNRSFSSDRSEFISEDLVFYFGYGSEGRELEALNPNLNFDIAEVPQSISADVRRTYGKFYALSPLKSSDNMAGTFKVISALSSNSAMSSLAEKVNMVPTKRSLVTQGTDDIFTRVAYKSAPIAYGWLMPNLPEAEAVFSEMVSDVNENRSIVNNAANDAEVKISRLYD